MSMSRTAAAVGVITILSAMCLSTAGASAAETPVGASGARPVQSAVTTSTSNPIKSVDDTQLTVTNNSAQTVTVHETNCYSQTIDQPVAPNHSVSVSGYGGCDEGQLSRGNRDVIGKITFADGHVQEFQGDNPMIGQPTVSMFALSQWHDYSLGEGDHYSRESMNFHVFDIARATDSGDAKQLSITIVS